MARMNDKQKHQGKRAKARSVGGSSIDRETNNHSLDPEDSPKKHRWKTKIRPDTQPGVMPGRTCGQILRDGFCSVKKGHRNYFAVSDTVALSDERAFLDTIPGQFPHAGAKWVDAHLETLTLLPNPICQENRRALAVPVTVT